MTVLLIIFAITYALIATDKIDKTIAALLGGGLAIGTGYISYEDALRAVDLNVIFLLVGMMMVINIIGRTGGFEWMAIRLAQAARGNGLVILVLFLVATAVISAFLDNVTTVLLMAPVTFLIAQILEIPVVPFLILEAVFSNIGGTATLVGDPPNVLIGSATGFSFNTFLWHLSPVVVVIGVVSLGVVVLVYGPQFRVNPALKDRVRRARPELAILDHRLLRWSMVVFALILLGFFLGRPLGIEPGLVALCGGAAMALVGRVSIAHVLERVEWNTILFFVGLFMLVGALEHNGLFDLLGRQMLSVTGGNLLLTCLLILVVSALASAIVDNIPLVIALIPLLQSIAPDFAQSMNITDPALVQSTVMYPLFWSLALGACLGGNGTLVGASANVVIAQVAARNRHPISFAQFTRIGLPIMLLNIVIGAVYVWWRYF
ncbi:MAG: ArsB/NhaD family transporter [Opitutaceae bacterium]|nr:ArsB/NhaD family transporter [Opitutaceae bacterium]